VTGSLRRHRETVWLPQRYRSWWLEQPFHDHAIPPLAFELAVTAIDAYHAEAAVLV
jgi:hypothetical protein